MADKIARRPPSYAVYASDDLASTRYYPLSAGERGVLDSMQRACWVDDAVPSDPRLLALVLRLQETDLRPFLTAAVLAHFKQDDVDAGRLLSPELTRQMTNLMGRRELQREGGREGAKTTNGARGKGSRAARSKGSRQRSGQHATTPAGLPATPELSREEKNREEERRSLEGGYTQLSREQAEFVSDLIKAEELESAGPPR
jgi:hypothetical protein